VLDAADDTRAEGIRRLERYFADVPGRFALAEARETAGDIAGAIQEYRHVLRLLEPADPFFEPQRAAAQRGLQRLAGER
jgi:predicted TPR repeat methyltransferase